MATHIDERGNRVSLADSRRVVVETSIEGRQGFLGRPVLMVLIGGLVLAMVAWGVSEMYGEAVDDDAATAVDQSTPADSNAAGSTDQKVIDNTPANGEQMQAAPTDRDPTPQSGTGGESQSVTPTGTEKTE